MKNKLPLFELTIEDEESGVEAIALVENPAIQKNFFAFNSKKNYIRFNDEKRELFGPAMIPNQKIYRTNGKDEFYVFFSEDTIRKIAQKFFKNQLTNNTNIEHNSRKDAGAYVFQSFIVSDTVKYDDLPNGSWVVGLKVEHEKTWNKIKDEKLKGFSVEGLFDFIEVENDNNMVSTLIEKETKMTIQDKIINLFSNFVKSQNQFSSQLKIDTIDWGVKVEKIESDGTLQPATDGEYKIDEATTIEVKDGLIYKINGEEKPKEEITEEELEDEQPNPMEDRIKAIEEKVEQLMKTIEENQTKNDEKFVEHNSRYINSLEKFNLQVEQLNSNIQLLAKVPVEFSNTNEKVEEVNEKKSKFTQLAEILGKKNKN